MRLIHLDETGVSNKPETEPYTIVAGVISNPDAHWKALDCRLKELADTYALSDQRDNFYFHAADIYHGNPKGFFPREKYTKDIRWKILDDLLQVPVEFDLGIFYGIEDRVKAAREHPGLNAHDLSILTHVLAFANCLSFAEGYLRKFVADEVAMLIVENRKEAHETIRKVQQFMLSSEQWKNEPANPVFPLEKIIESPFFASKASSSMLQIADACAFAVRLHWIKKPAADRFFEAIRPQVLVYPQYALPYGAFVSGK